MTFEKIEALVRAAEGRGLAKLELDADGARLVVTFDSAEDGGIAEDAGEPESAAQTASRSSSKPHHTPSAVVSPGVGFFRTTHPAGASLPLIGDVVATGTVLAFIQAGPVLLPVIAARNGLLGKALVAEGTGVGYGLPLFEFT